MSELEGLGECYLSCTCKDFAQLSALAASQGISGHGLKSLALNF